MPGQYLPTSYSFINHWLPKLLDGYIDFTAREDLGYRFHPIQRLHEIFTDLTLLKYKHKRTANFYYNIKSAFLARKGITNTVKIGTDAYNEVNFMPHSKITEGIVSIIGGSKGHTRKLSLADSTFGQFTQITQDYIDYCIEHDGQYRMTASGKRGIQPDVTLILTWNPDGHERSTVLTGECLDTFDPIITCPSIQQIGAIDRYLKSKNEQYFDIHNQLKLPGFMWCADNVFEYYLASAMQIPEAQRVITKKIPLLPASEYFVWLLLMNPPYLSQTLFDKAFPGGISYTQYEIRLNSYIQTIQRESPYEFLTHLPQHLAEYLACLSDDAVIDADLAQAVANLQYRLLGPMAGARPDMDHVKLHPASMWTPFQVFYWREGLRGVTNYPHLKGKPNYIPLVLPPQQPSAAGPASGFSWVDIPRSRLEWLAYLDPTFGPLRPDRQTTLHDINTILKLWNHYFRNRPYSVSFDVFNEWT